MIPPHTGTCIRLSLFTCTNERIHTRAHTQMPLKPPSKWTSRFCQQCRLSTILLWMSHWLSVTSAKQVKNIPPYIVFFLCPTHSTPPAAPIGWCPFSRRPHLFFLANVHSAIFLFPCSLDLISPLLLLFLASRLPNLFSHMSIDSVCFVFVCPTTRSPLASLLSLFPFWSLLVSFLSEGLLSCPSAARWPSIHQSVTARHHSSVCLLLNNCTSKANNSTCTQTQAQVEPGVLPQQGHTSPCTLIWQPAHRRC